MNKDFSILIHPVSRSLLYDYEPVFKVRYDLNHGGRSGNKPAQIFIQWKKRVKVQLMGPVAELVVVKSLNKP